LPYFESRLRVNFDDSNEVNSMLNFCEKLNIRNVILEPSNNIKNLSKDRLKIIEHISDINIHYRLNLRPLTLNMYKKDLRKYSKYPCFLSIETSIKEIQIKAAKDSRVHVLSYSEPDNMKTATLGVISLAKQNGTFIEFSLAPIMIANKGSQSRNFRLLYRFTQLLLKIKPNYIISGNFKNPYKLRHPRNLSSICHTLLGMPLNKAKEGFSRNVEALLKQVKSLKNENFFQDGIRLIKEDN